MKSIFYLLAVLLLTGCSKNTAPPDHVDNFTVYQEAGNAFVGYFSLVDKEGKPTSTGAQAEVIFEIKLKNESGYSTLKKESFRIEPDNFTTSKIGTGPFEREAFICPLGRYPFNDPDFVAKTGKRKWEEYTDVALPYGRVRLRVILHNTDVLEAETPVSYP